jgi:hypothetical protein
MGVSISFGLDDVMAGHALWLLMQKAAPKIVLSGWCLWVLYRLAVFFTDSIPRSAGATDWGAAIGGVLVPAIGCWLAWRLYARPRRGLAIWFTLVCLILLWKFCLASIMFRMFPSMGGLTLSGAIAAWWSLAASSLISAAMTVFSLGLIIFSLAYWPAYCLKRGRAAAHGATAALGAGRALCAECGEAFGVENMIRYDNLCVCAGCKPRFLQKLREGAGYK